MRKLRFALSAGLAWMALVVAPVPAAGASGSTPASPASQPSLTLAVIGDYGACVNACEVEQAVADLVHSWHPDAIVTVGDNSYENGTAAEVVADQGPYAGDIEAGRFYPVAGNHDWGNSCTLSAIAPSVAYFGRPPAYVAHLGAGLVDLFATDMNCGDPNGDLAGSTQARRYARALDASTALWKITAGHQPFYSSGKYGSQAYTHWAVLPQIDLYLSGHDHDFEHLVERGRNFVVAGVGGQSLRPVCAGGCIPGSTWHDDQHFGALRLSVSPGSLKVEFLAAGGAALHSFQLNHPAGWTQPPLGPDPDTRGVPAALRAAEYWAAWLTRTLGWPGLLLGLALGTALVTLLARGRRWREVSSPAGAVATAADESSER